MSKIIFLFPGQSSWHINMFDDLRSIDESITNNFLDRATDILGFSPDPLAPNNSTMPNLSKQIGVLVATHIYMSLLNHNGVESEASAGLSLGEYNHLIDIGALPYEDCLSVVHKRGQLYDEGPAGVMAAIFPISETDIKELLDRVNQRFNKNEPLYISNYNSPGQFVVAGTSVAVDEALRVADHQYYADGTIIEKAIAMHTPLFFPVAEKFESTLKCAKWHQPKKQYWSNVEGCAIDNITPTILPEYLLRHVCHAVRWRQIVDNILKKYTDCSFIEVGPRTVIYDLMLPKWHKFKRYHTAPKKNQLHNPFWEVVNEFR